MKKAEQIEVERNLITHSFWATGEEQGSITRIKMTAKERRGFHIQHVDMNANDLANLAREIKLLSKEIQDFLFLLLESKK